LVYFCHEQRFACKIEGWPLSVLSRKSIFFKTLKNYVQHHNI
jgi:hypothetical protein